MQQKTLSFGKLDQWLSNMRQSLPRLGLRFSISIAMCKQIKAKPLEQKPLEEPLTVESIMEW